VANRDRRIAAMRAREQVRNELRRSAGTCLRCGKDFAVTETLCIDCMLKKRDNDLLYRRFG
jgi:hypothetical protein